MKKPKLFATEVDLCAAFLAALPAGWIAYAETAGWDILLVRDADGLQIGIQAKLKLNAHVIAQCLEESGAWAADRAGPDCRAVLVSEGQTGFESITRYIGFTIIRARSASEFGPSWGRKPSFQPGLLGEPVSDREWHEWMPAKRHKLPQYVPDVPAGASAPVRLTPWKIKALKLMILAETRGFITRHDFKHLALDHRPFISAEGWLRPTEVRGQYRVHHPAPHSLKDQHPRVYEEIKAYAPNWMPKVMA